MAGDLSNEGDSESDRSKSNGEELETTIMVTDLKLLTKRRTNRCRRRRKFGNGQPDMLKAERIWPKSGQW